MVGFGLFQGFYGEPGIFLIPLGSRDIPHFSGLVLAFKLKNAYIRIVRGLSFDYIFTLT